MVQPVLDYMANLASGHRKARQVKYEITLLGVMMVPVFDLKPMANLKK
jgi:hypothetical protein